jgi:hypothetical protein
MQKIHSKRKYVPLSPEGIFSGGYYLDYYILKSEIKIPRSDILATVYGIEIEKKYEEDGIEKLIEKASLNDIFASMENTERLIVRLADKLILPSTLEYVIDDMLGEKGFEPPEITVNIL